MLIGAARNGEGSKTIRENRREYTNQSWQEWGGVRDDKKEQERVCQLKGQGRRTFSGRRAFARPKMCLKKEEKEEDDDERKKAEEKKSRRRLSQLVGVLSPVNRQGLYQGCRTTMRSLQCIMDSCRHPSELWWIQQIVAYRSGFQIRNRAKGEF